MKETIRRGIILIEIVILLITSIFTTVSTAVAYQQPTDEQKQWSVGLLIRNFAVEFVKQANSRNYGKVISYNDGASENWFIAGPEQAVVYSRNCRSTGYRYFLNQGGTTVARGKQRHKGDDTSWYIQVDEKLAFDCSSFVSFLYQYTVGEMLGIEGKINATSTSTYEHYKEHSDQCDKCPWEYVGYLKNLENTDLNPGDIIVYSGHIMMFNEANSDDTIIKVIDCGYGGAGTLKGALRYERNYKRSDLEKEKKAIVARLRVDYAVDVFDQIYNGGGGFNKPLYDEHFSTASLNWPDSTANIDLTGDGEVVNYTDENYFYYNGMPRKITVQGHENIFKKIIEFLSNILDWLLGLKFLGIKIQVVGWGGIVVDAIEGMVSKISGGIASTTSGRLEISDIIFNKVPILDINVFNFKEAGGQQLEIDSVIYKLRKTIAEWYYVLFTVTAIGLLVTLIYIGIRIAISTVAEKEAEYKRRLKDWFISVVILFTLHFFMLAVIKLNQSIVQLLCNASGGVGSLEAILYEDIIKLSASKSVPATIVYVVLIYYLVKFLLVYFKRLLNIAILTLIAPVVAIGYSIDKIKDGKSQSLSAWMKEYIYNVFLQMVHALIYSVFISFIFATIAGGDLWSLGTTIIIVLVALNFMLKSEKLVKKIFKIDAPGSKIGDIAEETLKGAITGLAGYKIGKKLVGAYAKQASKLVTKPAEKLAGFIGTKYLLNTKYRDSYKAVRETNTNATQEAKKKYKMARQSKNKSAIRLAKQNYKKVKAKGKTTIKGAKNIARSEARAQIDLVKERVKANVECAKKIASASYGVVKKTVSGVLILPFMAVNPQVGFGLLFAGIKGGGNAKRAGTTIRGYKRQFSNTKPTQEIINDYIQDFRVQNGREPTRAEINNFKKGYEEQILQDRGLSVAQKRYTLAYVTTSALTLGLSDKLIQSLVEDGKDEKDEDEKDGKKKKSIIEKKKDTTEKLKKCQQSLANATEAEMIIKQEMINIEEAEKKKQGSSKNPRIDSVIDETVRDNLRKALNDVFETNTSRLAISQLVTSRANKNCDLDADSIRGIMNDLGLDIEESQIEQLQHDGNNNINGVTQYVYDSLQAGRHNRTEMQGFKTILEQAEVLKQANAQVEKVLGRPLYDNIDALIETIVNL